MVSLQPTSSSPRFAHISALIIGLFVATSLSAAPYNLGGGTGAPPTDTSGSASQSASGSGSSPTTYGPGNTDLGGGTVTLAVAIFNGGTVSNGTLAASDGYTANSGEVTAILTGTAGLSKAYTDTSTFTISSASTYTGDTGISYGTLKLGAGGSITGSRIITIGFDATFDVADVPGGYSLVSGQSLNGAGSVAGALTVGAGATLTNRNGTPTFTGGLALNDGATLNFNLGSGIGLIAVSGSSLTGPSSGAITLNLSDDGDFAADTAYTLFDFTGATLAGFDLADFTLGTAPLGYDYSIEFNGNTLQLTAVASSVPEPATAALGFGSAALVAVLVRRRRLLVRGRA